MQKLCVQHVLKSQKIHGEATSENNKSVEVAISEVRSIIEQFELSYRVVTRLLREVDDRCGVLIFLYVK